MKKIFTLIGLLVAVTVMFTSCRKNYFALYKACADNDVETVKKYVAKNPDIAMHSEKYTTPDQEKLMKYLTKTRPTEFPAATTATEQISFAGTIYTPLAIASACGSTDVLKVLLDSQPNLKNSKRMYSLDGIPKDRTLDRLLVIAIHKRQLESIKMLVEYGANADAEMNYLKNELVIYVHKTPFNLAASNNFLDAMIYFSEKGFTSVGTVE